MYRKLILCLIALIGIQPVLAGLPLSSALPGIGGLSLAPGRALAADASYLGVQPYYSMWSQQLTPSMRLSFNLYHSNFVVQNTDMNLPGVGLPLTISRTSNVGTAAGQFGAFTLDSGSDVFLQLLTGLVRYHGPTGYTYDFTQNSNGTYAVPAGIDAGLVKNSDGTYTLTFDQSQLQYQFDSTGRLTQQVDRSGNRISYAYGGSGVNGTSKLSSITDTQNRTTTFTYNSASRISKITDPAGRVYTYGYNSTGTVLTSYTDPTGAVTQYGSDNSGHLNQITDPNGNVTTFGLSSYNSTSYTYFVTRTAPSGLCASPGCTWYFTVQDTGGTTTIQDPNSKTTSDVMDSTGRLTSSTDPENHQTQLAWTSDDHVSQQTLPSGAKTSGTYDSYNNLTQETLPTNATQKCSYGVSGVTGGSYLPYQCTDAQGHTTSYGYTSQGLVNKVTDANGKITSYTYNANGTLASKTDANGNTTSYGYDSMGRLSSVTNPAPLGGESYTYNTDNTVATKTDGNGKTTTYTHDKLGRLALASYADGTSEAYTYDGDGNTLTQTDGTGTQNNVTTFDCNGLNKVTDETLPAGPYLGDGHSIDYTYDGTGNMLTKTDTGGTVTYTYTSENLPSTVQEPGGATTSFQYDSNLNRTGIVFPNGVTESMTYDGARELTKIAASTGSTGLTSFTYTYSGTLRSSVTDIAGNKTAYTYDKLNRLTQAVQTNSSSVQIASYSYVYDPVGNLTSETLNGTASTMTYNAANELTAKNGSSYTYDGNGNQTSSPTIASTTYNAQNQATNIGGISMSYLGAGQAERTAAGTTGYQYDSTGLSTTTPVGSGTTSITRAPDGTLLGERIPGGSTGCTLPAGSYCSYYYLTDGLDSVVALTDSGGAVQDQYSYDPYGNVVGTPQERVPNSFRYADGIWDAQTGLYKLGARYYDPGTGRFTQPDPISGQADYVYAVDAPTNDTDPTGLDPKPPFSGKGWMDRAAAWFAREYGLDQQTVANEIHSLKGELGLRGDDKTGCDYEANLFVEGPGGDWKFQDNFAGVIGIADKVDSSPPPEDSVGDTGGVNWRDYMVEE